MSSLRPRRSPEMQDDGPFLRRRPIPLTRLLRGGRWGDGEPEVERPWYADDSDEEFGIYKVSDDEWNDDDSGDSTPESVPQPDLSARMDALSIASGSQLHRAVSSHEMARSVSDERAPVSARVPEPRNRSDNSRGNMGTRDQGREQPLEPGKQSSGLLVGRPRNRTQEQPSRGRNQSSRETKARRERQEHMYLLRIAADAAEDPDEQAMVRHVQHMAETIAHRTDRFLQNHTQRVAVGGASAPLNTECPICRDRPSLAHPFVQITNIRGCGHFIGWDCLVELLMDCELDKKSCPLCRRQWVPGIDEVLAEKASAVDGRMTEAYLKSPQGRPGRGGARGRLRSLFRF